MKTLKTIKLSLVAGIAMFASCQQNDVLYSIENPARESYIEFSNYINAMTRAAKSSGDNSFTVGDTMAVWGEQTTGNIMDVIFDNQDVRYVENNIWTYDNKKLWNIGSTYIFYGFFPYSTSLYTMSNDSNRFITVPTYTIPNDTESQLDLMISERRDVSPFNTVDMIFHHILSNVNIYVKIGDELDTTGIQSVVLKNLKLYNVMSTGRYEQTGWSQDRAVGSWSNISGYMDIPEVTEKVISKKSTAIIQNYLMMPQKLFSTESKPKDVNVDVTFRIVYKDGTSSTFVKNGIRLAGIMGYNGSDKKVLTHWEPNYRYNYTLAFNPQTATRIWEADGDGSIQIDPETGDTITDSDDTPYPGYMRYTPDEPDVVYVFEDTDGDGQPDTWVKWPVAWEDIDGDGLLEAGIDRDGDGRIDNVDGEDITQQVPGGDTDKDPTDGNPKNPDGKDVILVHYDSDDDGDIDDDDEWIQVQKDPNTGIITPVREEEDVTIQFTATVKEWEQKYSIDYGVNN